MIFENSEDKKTNLNNSEQQESEKISSESVENNLENSAQKIETESENNEKNSKKSRRFLKKESKLKDLENQIQSLTTKNISLEIESLKLKDKIKKIEDDFKSQVKIFEEKAAQKVKDIKSELQAKFENDQNHIKKYSLQPFFEEFISPFLNLKKAISYGLNTENPETSSYVKGFEMLVGQIENVMENFGITKIVPEIGGFFDSSVHEVYEVSDGEKDKISDIISIGYKLHDRVVKTALVVVGNTNEQKN
ncbi:nucleotide exchange factor GrpE [Mesomycoplasma ovipneumoniae]|uniref:nucleotide exchange factor GrpE n=1 Tax=Mesomycoplasma ovipneumoniae TaxID=29562 RepID=UPI0024AD4C3A|nr:nucleotide exchange factor GrpE [Mesomycoplasma ovipneumoniae]WHF53513.1 nucleotide exchange factor GrpE [Mesomycoplasma ovipneumoniae]